MSKETLPQDFIDQMKSMLGQETTAFLDSYNKPRTQALRLNTLEAQGRRYTAHCPAVPA
ncbi:hypothetical protein [Paenibacillus urinalis]|uniref:hypothetical protein n=1 Tax=Paenibacillus urinalis TaxID=521520 RepID=UPI003083BD37